MKDFINSWLLFILVVLLVFMLPARVPFLKKILVGDEARYV
jgi:hypothetical protein